MLVTLLPPTGAFAAIEPQTQIDLFQDLTSGDLRSHGKAWLLDTTTGQTITTESLAGDHTIEGAGGGGPILTRVTFSGRSQYEAIIFSSSYVLGECYEGTIQAFHATTVNPTRHRSSQVCPQLAPSSSTEDGSTINDEPSCECDPELGCSCTPILIDVQGDGFQLSGPGDAVAFDIDDGSELFGSAAPQPRSGDPNGFLALAVYDSPGHGGNSDRLVSSEDAIFDSLVLWRDVDHDGVSQPWELTFLRDTDIEAISVGYHLSRRRDSHGNWFRWAGTVERTRGQIPVVDVIFVTE